MAKKLALAALIILVSGALVWNYQEAVLDFLERGRDAAFDSERGRDARAPSVKKTLYFAGAEEDLLVPYPVEVEIGKDNVETLRNVLAALIEGPEGEGYAPVIPKGTKLRAAFPGPDGVAYVDFDETLRDAHPGGVWAELMTAYGVAGTVVKNFPDLFESRRAAHRGAGGAEHRGFARHHGSAPGARGVDRGQVFSAHSGWYSTRNIKRSESERRARDGQRAASRKRRRRAQGDPPAGGERSGQSGGRAAEKARRGRGGRTGKLPLRERHAGRNLNEVIQQPLLRG